MMTRMLSSGPGAGGRDDLGARLLAEHPRGEEWRQLDVTVANLTLVQVMQMGGLGIEDVRGFLGLGGGCGGDARLGPHGQAPPGLGLVRQHLGVAYDVEAARKLAEQVIWDAAQTKDNPADQSRLSLAWR